MLTDKFFKSSDDSVDVDRLLRNLENIGIARSKISDAAECTRRESRQGGVVHAMRTLDGHVNPISRRIREIIPEILPRFTKSVYESTWHTDNAFRFCAGSQWPFPGMDCVGETMWEVARACITARPWPELISTVADRQPFENFWFIWHAPGMTPCYFMTFHGSPVYKGDLFLGYEGKAKAERADGEYDTDR